MCNAMKSSPPPLWKRTLQPFIATMNVPPYGMLLFTGIYFGILGEALLRSVDALSHDSMAAKATTTTFVALWSLYGFYYCIFDTSAPQARKKSEWIEKWQSAFRSIWFIRWTSEYFQVQLVKTAELPPPKSNEHDANEENCGGAYIFNYHPHGVIGMGANLALSTDTCDFEQVFPGIRRSCATLNATYYVPFYRHWLLWLGCISANKETLFQRLYHQQESIVLMPGGAAEALHAHPGVFKLVLKKRKGFIKLALQAKAKLVPVLGFGENNLFDTVYLGKQTEQSGTEKPVAGPTAHHSWMFHVQHWMYKQLSFSLPLWFHFIAKPGPIAVVVGAPVEFPPGASVEECHALYVKALTDLYYAHRGAYGHKDIPLEIS